MSLKAAIATGNSDKGIAKNFRVGTNDNLGNTPTTVVLLKSFKLGEGSRFSSNLSLFGGITNARAECVAAASKKLPGMEHHLVAVQSRSEKKSRGRISMRYGGRLVWGLVVIEHV